MAEIRHQLLPKQEEFIKAQEREVLYSGAFGAGKSRAVCFKLLIRACVPGARELLTRKTNVALKKTTLHTLLQRDGDLQPVLPTGTYEHNKSEQRIKIKGGGEILYDGLDSPTKIGSLQLTGVGVDEAVEFTENDWTMLRGRIRVNVAGLPNQIYGACNPGAPSHFLAKRFGLALKAKAVSNCRAISTASKENPFLPADYLADLNTLTGVAKKRFVEGLWVGSEGLIYDKWNREIHIRTRKEKWKFTIIAIDEGYSNPFCALRLNVDGDGRVHVDREIYQTKLLNRDKIERVKIMIESPRSTTAVIPPEAADLIDEFILADIATEPADNSVFSGIMKVQQYLEDPGDGKARLTIDPCCENLIREMESYEWRPEKDAPVKAFDHAVDALRYGIMDVARQGEGMRITLI